LRTWLEYRKERKRLLNFLRQHRGEKFTEGELETLGFKFLERLLRRPLFMPLYPTDGEFPISAIGFHRHNDEKVYYYRTKP